MTRSKNQMPYIDLNDCKNLTKIKLYKNKCGIWIKKKTDTVCLSLRHYFRDLDYISDI